MKARSGLGSLITNTVLIVIGGGLIYGNLFNRELGTRISEWISTPVGGLILGGVMIASVVLGWLTRFFVKKEKFIDFQSEDGSVGISTKAIKDFIERVGKEFTAVKSIDSQLIHNKGNVDIAISVKLLSGNKIPELIQMLQQRVRESVRESLGIDGIGTITVKVAEIIGEPARHVEDDLVDS
ncbi:alkaline shock response membrane anchor protein AmaP [Pontiellaceae bacterium B12227]|nr:alkaline shock response membrane anchor protein AmaP [Pontiellaceae bacterium B12227]